jgi:valyl-tRNA synthetase
MSKSLGNGVDPLDVIDQYGADALRFMLATGNAAGADIRFREEKVEAARNFANKIWNASRFVMMNFDKDLMDKYKNNKKYSFADKWILSRANTVVKEVTENVDKYELGIAAQKVYDFMWTEFCDWYIELAKPVLYGNDEEQKGIALNVLHKVLTIGIQLLHPAMPFITEEIYLHLEEEFESITISKWPEYSAELEDAKAESQMAYVIEAIKALRNTRLEMNVPASRKAKVIAFITEENAKAAFQEGKAYFEKLASASEIEVILSKESGLENTVSVITKGAELFMPLLDLIDLDKEIERLMKEKDKLVSEIDRVEKKLTNERFVAKAPQAVVDEEKAKGEKYKEMLLAVETRLNGLK